MTKRQTPIQIIILCFIINILFPWLDDCNLFCASDDHKTVNTSDFRFILKHQCTSFCLDNDNFAIFGANFDYGKNVNDGLVFINKRNVSKSYWVSDQISEHAHWTSKYGSITFNLIMQHFAWGGMNEAGLIISTLELPGSQTPAADKRPWIYSNYWVQYILDNFSTVEEVIASDSSIRISDYVDHYLVCDRTGKCATIEFLEGKIVYHTGIDLPIKALSNSQYSKSIVEWNNFKEDKSNPDPASIKSNSLRRFVLAAQGITKYKATDPDSAIAFAFNLLDEVSGQKTNGSPTRWSIAFDAENFRIFFRTIIHDKVRYLILNDIDFSCETPVKMIDINEKHEGNITNQLKVYSTDFHFNHAFSAFKKWGVEYDPTELKQNIGFLENFKCEDPVIFTKKSEVKPQKKD